MSKHAIITGTLVITAIYFAAVALVHYGGSDSSLATYVDTHHLNSLGDFLSGVFSPLAFLWLTATVLIQSNELALQRNELTESREVMKEQAKAAKEQADFIGLQTQAMRDQIELQKRVAEATYKASLLPERFGIYNGFLAHRTRLLKISPAQAMEMVLLTSRAMLLFGSELRDHLNKLLSEVISYQIDLEHFENKHGHGAFVDYQERMETDNWKGSPIDLRELDSFKIELQALVDAANEIEQTIDSNLIMQKMRAAMTMNLHLSTE